MAVAMGSLEHYIEHHKDVHEECLEKSGSTEDLAMSTLAREGEASAEGRCYLNCLFDHLTIMVDGKYSLDNSKELLRHKYESEPEKMAKVHAIAEECDQEVESDGKDPCEVAYELFTCYRGKKDEQDLGD
ncbi:uncharacterized protein [Anabrus simplex]|uniref:uncharacterized protein n=1 Tax=Anabrus simplex TaxID=316456 RepID=UPI0035A311CC